MFQLPNLPYPYDALAPVISAETLHFHHDKHHAGYVRATNDILAMRNLATTSLEMTDGRWPFLEEVVSHAAAVSNMKLLNNAAQAWNHAFYWVCMSPNHEQPTGDLETAIKAAFGSLAGLKEAFVGAGAGHFGSGWVWLAADMQGRLQVITTHDAGSILTQPELMPVLVADLWEHAYYVDYRNDRRAHLEAWFDALPNWGLAARQLIATRSNASQWGYAPPSRLVPVS